MSRKRLVAGLVVAALALTSLALAQQQPQPKVKKTQNAVITAQTMEYDWANNTVDFTGKTKVVLTGDYDATMTAPTLAVKLSPKGDRVLSMVAAGPVSFTIMTKPDANGQRRKIVGSAKEQATYSDETQILKLIGGATADLLPAEPGTAAPATGGTPPAEGLARADAIHFTGQTITANLKTNKMTVDDANLQVETKAQ